MHEQRFFVFLDLDCLNGYNPSFYSSGALESRILMI
jgi:hypothetical protein